VSLRPRMVQPEVETATRSALWDRIRPALSGLVSGLGLPVPQSPGCLAELPFTHKSHLQGFDSFRVPRRALVRLHSSSGTAGPRTLVGYTAADLALWTRLVARGLAAVGVNEDSVVYSVLGHGLFTGGFGFTQAATALGALVVPGGGARSAVHVAMMRQVCPDVLFATPSYALHLARAHGPVPPISLGVFGAEPWSEADRRALSREYGMQAVDTYGLSEAIGPGVAFECPEHNGLHLNADAFWPEVVDADGQPVRDGTEGELVLSAPTKEALPLLRYRTGDRTRLDWSPCPCGRTLPRMSRVTGRVDEMVVVRGVNVRPSQVSAALSAHPSTGWQLEVSRGATGLDELAIVVESALPEVVFDKLQDALGLRLVQRVVPILPHSGGKAVRLVDLRAEGQP